MYQLQGIHSNKQSECFILVASKLSGLVHQKFLCCKLPVSLQPDGPEAWTSLICRSETCCQILQVVLHLYLAPQARTAMSNKRSPLITNLIQLTPIIHFEGSFISRQTKHGDLRPTILYHLLVRLEIKS